MIPDVKASGDGLVNPNLMVLAQHRVSIECNRLKVVPPPGPER
jgi:hypothetical protein